MVNHLGPSAVGAHEFGDMRSLAVVLVPYGANLI